ncbi:MAG: ubiquitin-like domain-containing protein, partial [Chloroflexota bacterium]
MNPPDRSSFGALGAKAPVALGRVPWVWLGQRALLALTCATALAGGYAVTQKRIEISIDGYRRPFHTHQSSVKNILEEAGILLYPEDRVFPPLESKIDANGKIVIQRALLVEIQADGQTYHLRTQSKTIREALDQAGLTLEPRDEVSLNGTAASPLSPLPVVAALLERALAISQSIAVRGGSAVASAPAKEARLWMGASAVPFSPALEFSPQASPDLSPASVTISITRAVPLHVHDGTAFSTIFSAAETVGEALERENIPVYLGDRVAPPLTAPLRPGMSVHIVRAKPVTILVDDRTWKTRTQSTSIYRLLQEEGVNLVGKDYTIPAVTSTIASN